MGNPFLVLCLHRHCNLLITNTHCLIARSSPCNSPKYQGSVSPPSDSARSFPLISSIDFQCVFNIYLIQCSNNIYNQLSQDAMISSCALSVILSTLQRALSELFQICLRLQLSGERLDTQILVYCTYLAAGFSHLQ